MANKTAKKPYDVFVVGGGINGCGIARDAAGRNLSVALAEMNDLGSATSSASTKMFHGGLRYLEYFDIKLVRHALQEREVLLKAMPHISWPMRFVLPYHADMRFEGSTPASRLLAMVAPWFKGRRPAWLIRFGLFLYDHLGGREILPATKTISLKNTPEGLPLKDKFEWAYEYSDCWVDDSRLVAANARDAKERGADIFVRTKLVSAARADGLWELVLADADTKRKRTVRARVLVNAAGPWAGDVIENQLQLSSKKNVRLVRGSHIVTERLFEHDKCYFFQGLDGRIIFAIPYEERFTLIGTTDVDHADLGEKPVCTDNEADYLLNFANQYFKKTIAREDIVWTYSGVRPLYDDGRNSASAATRDYVLDLDEGANTPLLSVFGGKITTYRVLAEEALEKLSAYFPSGSEKWTAGIALPGGDFPVDGVSQLVEALLQKYEFLSHDWATRLVKAYGTEASRVLGQATAKSDLGKWFGATLTEREVRWLMTKEYARSADDVVWRRSKLGLLLNEQEVRALNRWMRTAISELAA